MDIVGLRWSRRKKTGFEINRPLTYEERANQYKQEDSVDAVPRSYLTVIKMNSTYMDLVDKWYPMKGMLTWFGICGALVGLFGAWTVIWMFFWAPITEHRYVLWFLMIFIMPIALGLVGVVIWMACFECFRWTHYPIRLNRKTGQVHFFSQDGTVLTVPWKKLFITKVINSNKLAFNKGDLRANILADDGETVLDTYPLGFTMWGEKEGPDHMWAFIQPYMEAPDGDKKTYDYLEGTLMLPIDGRRESVRWGIAQSFVFCASWPILQLFGSIVFGMNALGRIIAMRTCKVPRWPQEVETASVVDKDDPYVLTSDDNFELGWQYFYWPLICTILGVAASLAIIVWMRP